MNPAASSTAMLAHEGVSIWLDDLSRQRILSGDLQRLIVQRDVVGVTTNPTIFAAAVGGSSAYDEQIAALAETNASANEVAFALTTDDVAKAADILRPVFDASGGVDGWVSIEVGADAAHDTLATLVETRSLAEHIDRPNVFVKIPATLEGVSAITAAIALGISVNVTLIFSLDRYRAVVDAYLTGLERAHESGLALRDIRSVASFFVSRVDTEVDRRLDAIGTAAARELRSRAGIANARLAYEIFTREFASSRAQRLLAMGANVQRPLWASTGVKDPALPDTRYVESSSRARSSSRCPSRRSTRCSTTAASAGTPSRAPPPSPAPCSRVSKTSASPMTRSPRPSSARASRSSGRRARNSSRPSRRHSRAHGQDGDDGCRSRPSRCSEGRLSG